MKYFAKVGWIVFFLTVGASPLLFGDTLKIEGKDATNLKVTFNPSRLDRSTPEKTVESFVHLFQNLEVTLGNVLDKIHLNSMKKILLKVCTPRNVQRILRSKLENLKKRERSRKETSFSFSFKVLKKKKQKDGATVLLYLMTTKISSPCSSCKKKDGKKCSSCKGTGFRTKVRVKKGKSVLIKDGDNWLIRNQYSKCWSCNGKGVCSSCILNKNAKGSLVPRPKKCYSCGGTKICNTCKGELYRENREFQRDVPKFVGFPSLTLETLKFSTGKETLTSFNKVANLSVSVKKIMRSKLAFAFKKMIQYFMADPFSQKGKIIKYAPLKYTLLKIQNIDKKNISVLFQDGKQKKKVLKLLLDKKGNWKVDGIFVECSNCKGSGIGTIWKTRYFCKNHKKAEVIYTKRGALCQICQNPMNKIRSTVKGKKCSGCSGKGKKLVQNFYDAF